MFAPRNSRMQSMHRRMPAKTTGPGIEVQGPKSIAEAADDDADADTND